MRKQLFFIFAFLSISCSIPKYPVYSKNERKVADPDIVILKQAMSRKDLRGDHIIRVVPNIDPQGNYIILNYNGGIEQNSGVFFEYRSYNYYGTCFAGYWHFSGDTIVLENRVGTFPYWGEMKDGFIRERKLIIKDDAVFDLTDYLSFHLSLWADFFAEDPSDKEGNDMVRSMIHDDYGIPVKYKILKGKRLLNIWKKRHIRVYAGGLS